MTGAMIDFPGAPNPARPDAPAPGTASGYLSVPAAGSGPGIVVAHAWWGLNDTFRGVADRLAASGFVALAPDLYGDGAAATTIEEAEARRGALDEARAEQAAMGALERLRADPATAGSKLGTIGFSMGVDFAWWLADKRPEVGAVVLLYSPGGDPAKSQAPIQHHYSPQDEYEDAAYIEAWTRKVRGTGRPLESYAYPGRAHWFFEPDRPEHDAADAELVWERLLDFFRRELRSGT
jgi:carboxymethylenebutenolidase